MGDYSRKPLVLFALAMTRLCRCEPPQGAKQSPSWLREMASLRYS
jgi:hypothetical protein